ncbi:MAG TPA: RNA 2',3'-cyclic phosphodiesterase [Pyrinomonadaceae bacterium]|nr:RNA 2',3'-cyclic phosphodiesterase [Pyrinomonadaceae bacterium]
MPSEASKETWRVFCAIELPEQVRELLAQHIVSLRRAVPDARASWSRTENIHLTLKFLGELQITQVKTFSDAVIRATTGFSPFTLGVGEPGAFPTHGSPRVLWIGVNDFSGKLADLHARLEYESQQVGFEKETRSFHPHFTLARFREQRRRVKQSRADEGQRARDLASAHKTMQLPSVEIAVTELLVIRSELGVGGSKYTVISGHPLGMAGKL